ncbi:Ig-like domain-containing protein [Desulfoluna spongiiphila]|uniref:Fibronectin type-III domain-containing protein n=1 Tax=Desulfoluna spongiiphila TaxID=419481 RepID=A0A1G5JB61_9BACT|nr:Ig-like domain-containing protein [Desulfoluna spongiiphila]SCY85542.1 hypothetical protein SAMN05216233_12740 [Desulfoluna spongiiphila]
MGYRYCWMMKWLVGFLLLNSLCFASGVAWSAETLCAEVKIEIRQEVTLERQAFDAHMRINNGLTSIALEDVAITVRFIDEEGTAVLASSDPDDKDASFFIRVDTKDNIENISGSGVVKPASSADIHWLIIPSPGASNGLEAGKLYYVGATLTYTLGGEENKTEVNPDYIFVKPMPDLVLDYFLTKNVIGDDPLTDEVEGIEPFTLGVRVKNTGKGTARKLKIESAQPKIVENEQGLLVGFVIEGCEVDNKPKEPTLLADFGDIPSSTSKIARWIMTCSLSGRFTEFTADFSHSDELGGEMTSLIESVNTHFLVRDVIADLPGRDAVCDFLAVDEAASNMTVFESDGTDTVVTDQSETSSFQSNGAVHIPLTAGFVYARFNDPFNGTKQMKRAVRSDGKQIREENVWFSKEKDAEKKWVYSLNIFDVNTTGTYTLYFDEINGTPKPPVIQFVSDRTGVEMTNLSFVVQSSDPNGTIPTLTGKNLPVGAVFTDRGDGEGSFEWTPAVGQAGSYGLTFIASDGELTASKSCTLVIRTKDDTDGDQMADLWEMTYFGNLDRDGLGDSDGDGISDLDEFLLGADPTSVDNVPGVPMILSPCEGEEVTSCRPVFTLKNSIPFDGKKTTYEFEIYSDQGFNELVAVSGVVDEGDGQTVWAPDADLMDNHEYNVRVRATNGAGYSLWNHGRFFVNTENDAPDAFFLSAPADGGKVNSLNPALEITNPKDKDRDLLFCKFDVYSDAGMTDQIAFSGSVPLGALGATSWTVPGGTNSLEDGETYYWNAVAEDAHGLVTETTASSFTVDLSGAVPKHPAGLLPEAGTELAAEEVTLSVRDTGESDTVVYHFEVDCVDTFDSPDKITSQPVIPGSDAAKWHVDGLKDDSLYYWRCKAVDGEFESRWALSRFFVSLYNGAPDVPVLKNPGGQAWVRKTRPTFSAHPSTDPEADAVTYQFEIFSDEAMETLVSDGVSQGTEWKVADELSDNTRYYVRAAAQDENGLSGGWTDASPFFVRSAGINTPPSFEWVSPSADSTVDSGDILELKWRTFDPDSDALTAIYFDTDGEGEDGTVITSGRDEEIRISDWDVSGLSGEFYLYAIVKDENTTRHIYNPFLITVNRDSDGDGVPDHLDLFPDDPEESTDFDGDGVGDNADMDDDNDSMTDAWETANNLDPFNAEDALLDKDNDSVNNVDEFFGGSDPSNAYSIPSVENFETGDLVLFSWSAQGDARWAVVDDTSSNISGDENSLFIARSPHIGDGDRAGLRVKMLCEKGVISFGYALSTETDHDTLTLYMDDQLLGEWSGISPYERSCEFPVPYGMHTFRWEYARDAEGGAGENCVWIDDIRFPMSKDSDGDLMPDRWEEEHSLNPNWDDGAEDEDGDGYDNLLEFSAGSAADDPTSYPQVEMVTEGFETGSFSSGNLVWHLGGDLEWSVGAGAADQGSFAAESPSLSVGENAFADVIRYCDKGAVSFMHMTDSDASNGFLEFLIDDALKGSWSGSNAYALFGPHDVPSGIHTFRWKYRNDGDPSGLGTGRFDSIALTGFIDGDGDNMPDGWEIKKGMNPLADDAHRDADQDGVSNIEEYRAEVLPSDRETPTPNPAGFASEPSEAGKHAITMTALTANDESGVQYYFEETGGNAGGSDSGWQRSPVYTDTGLDADTMYTYRVKVRDKSANRNETEWSEAYSVVTEAYDLEPPSPNPAGFASAPSANKKKDRIFMTAKTATDPSGVEYYFEETSGHSGGSSSGWQSSPSYVDTGLSKKTTYTYRVKYRDKSEHRNETGWSESRSAKTKLIGCGAEPMYRDGSGKRPSGPSSLLFALLPLLPGFVSLFVWYVVVVRRKPGKLQE